MRRSPEMVRALAEDAKRSERERKRRAPVETDTRRDRGRGHLGELAASSRDGHAWTGHTRKGDGWGIEET